MKRTTIFADDELVMELKELSKEEGRSVAELVREAIGKFLVSKKSVRKNISFIGAGRSGKKNIATIHEELLWRKNSPEK